jgi:hypothetical protein
MHPNAPKVVPRLQIRIQKGSQNSKSESQAMHNSRKWHCFGSSPGGLREAPWIKWRLSQSTKIRQLCCPSIAYTGFPIRDKLHEKSFLVLATNVLGEVRILVLHERTARDLPQQEEKKLVTYCPLCGCIWEPLDKDQEAITSYLADRTHPHTKAHTLIYGIPA